MAAIASYDYGASTYGDEVIRVVRVDVGSAEGDDHAVVIEEDRGCEHSVSETSAKAAVNEDEVTVYTNCHGMTYLEVTAVEDMDVRECPSDVADVLVAHLNVSICPIDGGEPGSGVETGTLI